jgi:hypothetical protein
MNQQPQFTFTLPASPAEPRRARYSKALWLVGIGLLANAGVMLFSRGQAPDITFDRAALAQATPAAQPGQLLGARGIYMMPAQLGPNTFGLYLMDVDSSTLCVYRAIPETSHFRLMAARSFKYDRFLEDFNNETLRPKEVQKIVEAQQQRLDLQQKDDQPTVDQNAKPSDNLPDVPRPNIPQ